jgi:transcription initiation factor TFIIIB Brf1 subunit/transcription initiation factor TFIIB
MSRNPHEPSAQTRAEVSALKSFGVAQSDIANYIGVDDKTLRKHYREELDTAQTKADANVAKFLYNAASGKALDAGASHADCVRAAMFWAKTRMKWRETDNEAQGNGNPITINVVDPNDTSTSD